MPYLGPTYILKSTFFLFYLKFKFNGHPVKFISKSVSSNPYDISQIPTQCRVFVHPIGTTSACHYKLIYEYGDCLARFCLGAIHPGLLWTVFDVDGTSPFIAPATSASQLSDLCCLVAYLTSPPGCPVNTSNSTVETGLTFPPHMSSCYLPAQWMVSPPGPQPWCVLLCHRSPQSADKPCWLYWACFPPMPFLSTPLSLSS